MITTILRTADTAHINVARKWVSDHLHIPESDVTPVVAVAYICRHFEQGVYYGWDGFVDMLKADQAAFTRRKGASS